MVLSLNSKQCINIYLLFKKLKILFLYVDFKLWKHFVIYQLAEVWEVSYLMAVFDSVDLSEVRDTCLDVIVSSLDGFAKIHSKSIFYNWLFR